MTLTNLRKRGRDDDESAFLPISKRKPQDNPLSGPSVPNDFFNSTISDGASLSNDDHHHHHLSPPVNVPTFTVTSSQFLSTSATASQSNDVDSKNVANTNHFRSGFTDGNETQSSGAHHEVNSMLANPQVGPSYQPFLSNSENPIYFEQNRILFEAHMSRLQRQQIKVR
ncbi:uncharacterized protein LOC141853775 [Brevipalpus obovatus]|uniref:uncharacterized protein LOC141853775 n=1 Tax=Brevipalpus obovatus TaxID=246614 RepID=UPI003D9EDDF2